jgi:hypothetical protein
MNKRKLSEKQTAAARANGKNSHGPVTPEGKLRSSRNSPRHGLLARAIVLEGESRDRFNDLVRQLNEALKPRTQIEHLLVGKMAASHWRQVRVWNLEREGEKTLGDHEMRLDRQFFRTLDRYLKLQAVSNKNDAKSFSKQTNPRSN